MGTNPAFFPTNAPAVTGRLNDIGFRIILIPVLGIVIPLATGLIPPGQFTHWQIKMSYCYTIGIAFLIWQGNRYLLFTLRSYFNWFKYPLRKIAVLLIVIPLYTIPVAVLLLTGWYQIFLQGKTDWTNIVQTTLIILVAVVFIVHVYETVFLVKESESEMLRNAQLERARTETALEALRNQIDPHFIFNSLNTLSHLIESSPEKARQFNDTLADTYRYILSNKGRDLVLLRDELSFLDNFFALLKIRFGDALICENLVADADCDKYLLPPISLQLLMENAIKHNEFSRQDPLQMRVSLVGKTLVFSNMARERRQDRRSSGIGLNNLQKRYLLITGLPIDVIDAENSFVVMLPVLTLD
ncbi:sensor histidine kinase [Flavihumibacter petaseus]|uniref:Putative two-component histidine kinase n=1 Tax=Flavihumibacter petaseus NBRC 106054 TaxID=1220578 RepID=A0A0E9MXK0_9BACT|nr:histidine kinase [Flavihumibacter petaseus]GAO42233.1 putative two-component histidine kinase [Flavihumibacter petaseus NBRC 106054]